MRLDVLSTKLEGLFYASTTLTEPQRALLEGALSTCGKAQIQKTLQDYGLLNQKDPVAVEGNFPDYWVKQGENVVLTINLLQGSITDAGERGAYVHLPESLMDHPVIVPLLQKDFRIKSTQRNSASEYFITLVRQGAPDVQKYFIFKPNRIKQYALFILESDKTCSLYRGIKKPDVLFGIGGKKDTVWQAVHKPGVFRVRNAKNAECQYLIEGNKKGEFDISYCSNGQKTKKVVGALACERPFYTALYEGFEKSQWVQAEAVDRHKTVRLSRYNQVFTLCSKNVRSGLYVWSAALKPPHSVGIIMQEKKGDALHWWWVPTLPFIRAGSECTTDFTYNPAEDHLSPSIVKLKYDASTRKITLTDQSGGLFLTYFWLGHNEPEKALEVLTSLKRFWGIDTPSPLSSMLIDWLIFGEGTPSIAESNPKAVFVSIKAYLLFRAFSSDITTDGHNDRVSSRMKERLAFLSKAYFLGKVRSNLSLLSDAALTAKESGALKAFLPEGGTAWPAPDTQSFRFLPTGIWERGDNCIDLRLTLKEEDTLDPLLVHSDTKLIAWAKEVNKVACAKKRTLFDQYLNRQIEILLKSNKTMPSHFVLCVKFRDHFDHTLEHLKTQRSGSLGSMLGSAIKEVKLLWGSEKKAQLEISERNAWL